MSTILVVSKEFNISAALKKLLLDASYQLLFAYDAKQVKKTLTETVVDILLVDVENHERSEQLALASDVSKRFHTPILIIADTVDEAFVIDCFNAGADQYLPRPYSGEQLLMRFRSLLRRVEFENNRQRPSFTTNTLAQSLAEMPLTITEEKLLKYLMQSRGGPVAKKELQTQVLLNDFSQHDRNLDMHISNIRRKLTQFGFSKELIMTIRNKGYSFQESQQ